MSQAVRVVFAAEKAGGTDIRVDLVEGRPWWVIGRGGGVDHSLDDPTVGKRHCQLMVEGGVVKLMNLDHARGTWQNGLPIDESSELKEGDKIEIGDLGYKVKLDKLAGAEPAAPAGPVAVEPQVEAAAATTAPVEAPRAPMRPEASRSRFGRMSSAPLPSPPPAPPVDESKPDAPADAAVPAAEAPAPPTASNRSYGQAGTTRPSFGRPPLGGLSGRSSAFGRGSGGASRPTPPPPNNAPPAGGAPSRSILSARSKPLSPPPPPSVKPAEPTPVTDAPAEPVAPEAPPPPPPEPLEEAEPPKPSLPPPDSFVRMAMDELVLKHGRHTEKLSRQQMQELAQRGREQAKKMGFAADDEILQFLECMVLLDDDLTGPNPKNTDVWYTLNMANRPAPMRLRRALTLSQRIAEQRAAGVLPVQEASPPPPQQQPQQQPELPDRPRQAMSLGPLPVTRNPPPAVRKPVEPPREEAKPTPAAANVEAAPSPVAEEMPAPVAERPRTPAPRAPSPPPRIDAGPAEPAAAPPGRQGPHPQIEGFTIVSKIGAGGMGDVFKARDTGLDREVAIKVLRSMHPAAQEQFLTEARSAAKLEHPNIVQILRYGQIGEGGYYVMQLIKGMDAEQLLKVLREHVPQLKSGQELFTLAGVDAASVAPELRNAAAQPKPYYHFVACWLAGVADGLERAHTMGVVHRDVKPDNMLLAQDGRLMLSDFGLAHKNDDPRGIGAGNNTTCVGTPRYLAPEMLAAWASGAGQAGTDERVDIWGLGCSLYEFLAFRPAYDGPVSRVLRDIATLNPTPPREYVWQCPEGLEAICLKALHRNPEERYRRAAEVADELRTWLAGEMPMAERVLKQAKEKANSGIFGWLRKAK